MLVEVLHPASQLNAAPPLVCNTTAAAVVQTRRCWLNRRASPLVADADAAMLVEAPRLATQRRAAAAQPPVSLLASLVLPVVSSGG